MKRIYAILMLFCIGLLMVSFTAAQSSSGTKFRAGATLDVQFLSQDPDPVEPGQYVDLRWKVQNLGTENLENVIFEIDLDYPFTLNDPNERTKQLGDVGTTQAGEDAIIVHWRVLVNENAPEGDHEVRVNYYIDDVGVKLSPFTVRVKSRQALLAVERIALVPTDPLPGQLVNVTIALRNAVDTSVQDVKLKIGVDETSFAPIGSTNEKVVKRIGGGELVEIPFVLAVGANAEAKVHNIPLSITYANRFGDTFVLNTSFGLRVAPSSDYLINLEKTEVYTAGSSGEIILSVSNIGKSDLNFVTLGLEPTEQYRVLSAPQVYLGNLESDDFETAEFEIFIAKNVKPGNLPLKAVLTYKDAYNTAVTTDVEVPLRIYSSSEAKRLGLKSDGTGLLWLIVLAIAVLVIVDWRRKWVWSKWIRQRLKKEHKR